MLIIYKARAVLFNNLRLNTAQQTCIHFDIGLYIMQINIMVWLVSKLNQSYFNLDWTFYL